MDSDPAIENRKAAPQTKIQNREGWSRREFLARRRLPEAGTLSRIANSDAFAAEPPPETTRIRLAYHSRSLCHAPLYVAKIPCVARGSPMCSMSRPTAVEKALASGEVDIVTHFCGPLAAQVDNGDPIVILSRASSRLRRAGRHRPDPLDPRPERKDRRGTPTWEAVAMSSSPSWRRMSASTRVRISTSLPIPRAKRCACSPKKRSTHSWRSARLAGVAGEEDRSRRRQQHDRPTVVPVLLLHGGSEPAVRPKESGRR